MWNFPVGSFGSFSLLLRENIFTLCLAPQRTYSIEIVDDTGDGLASTFNGNLFFGAFSILYEDQVVTTYNGDCGVDEDVRECGAYCRCRYELISGSGSTGECTTECEDAVV